MKELKFRTLYANEIEIKPTIIANQIELALHVRAETCTNILNEEVGPMNWEKEYTFNNKNCIVRIWDTEKNRMISKEDCGGSPTDVDGLKGQASNGFKRVCALGWGLGIELYSQPKIMIPTTDDNTTYDKLNQLIVTESYSVSKIVYNDKRKITEVEIVDSNGNVVYPVAAKNTSVTVTEKPQVEFEAENDPDAIAIAEAENIIQEEDAMQSAIAAAEADIVDDLPDNTDGYDNSETFMTQDAPYEDYSVVIEREVKRTNTRRSDVLRALKIDSLDKIDEVEEALIQNVIQRLKERPDFKKNS